MGSQQSGVDGTRRKAIEAIRADRAKGESKELQLIKRKLRSQLEARRETCELYPHEAELLLRAIEDKHEKAGRPEHLGKFYEFMAAHFLWRRANCSSEPIKASYSIVAEKWGITDSAVRKAVKKHKQAADTLLKTSSEMFVEKMNSAGVDQSALGVTARAFCILMDPKAFKTAEKARTNISLGKPLK